MKAGIKKIFNEISETNFLQDNHSRSNKGVLRGITLSIKSLCSRIN